MWNGIPPIPEPTVQLGPHKQVFACSNLTGKRNRVPASMPKNLSARPLARQPAPTLWLCSDEYGPEQEKRIVSVNWGVNPDQWFELNTGRRYD